MNTAAILERLPQGIQRRLAAGRRADTLPLSLGQRRIYVLPTTAGLAFAAALLVMLIGAINYGLSLGYGLVFLLVGVGITSTVHAFRNLLGLSANHAHIEPVFAGDAAVLRIQLENPRALRRPALNIEAAGAKMRLTLAAFATGEAELPLTTRERGWLTIDRITVATTYPLGLVRAWSVLRPTIGCLIYPAPEKDAPPLPVGADEQQGRRPQVLGDDDFAGLRPHRITDSPRHVAWKAAASGRPLLTKEFSAHEGDAIALDWHALPASLDDDARASRLAAWVLSAEARGLRYALTTPEGDLPAQRGAHHMRACLARLALAKSDHGTR